MNPGFQYAVVVSLLEIYNERCYDLFAGPPSYQNGAFVPDKRQELQIQYENGRVRVNNLKEVTLPDLESAAGVLRVGLQNRQTAMTAANELSSRSHSVFIIKLVRLDPEVTRITH